MEITKSQDESGSRASSVCSSSFVFTGGICSHSGSSRLRVGMHQQRWLFLGNRHVAPVLTKVTFPISVIQGTPTESYLWERFPGSSLCDLYLALIRIYIPFSVWLRDLAWSKQMWRAWNTYFSHCCGTFHSTPWWIHMYSPIPVLCSDPTREI